MNLRDCGSPDAGHGSWQGENFFWGALLITIQRQMGGTNELTEFQTSSS